MKINSKDSFKSLKKLKVDNKIYNIFSLKEAEKNGLTGISKLPKSIKVLLENLLRFEDEKSVRKEQILSIKSWLDKKKSKTEISFRPARVLMQDYTGIPAIADLAAMRDAVKSKALNRIIIAYDDERFLPYLDKWEGKLEGYLRPKILSKPGITSLDVLSHVLSHEKDRNTSPDYVMLLEITHPLRPPGIIKQLVETTKNQTVDSLVTVYPVHYNFWKKNYYSKSEYGTKLRNMKTTF